MAQRLIVEIIGDSRSLERSLQRSERSARSFSSRMGRTLGRVGIAAGAALGAGVTVGLKKSLDAAMEAQKVLGQTKVALRNVGASWAQYGNQIQTSTTALSRLAAVQDEELLQSFSALLRGTKDVNRALELNAVAADVARGRNMELSSAAQLLVKVNAGQLGSARRLGIMLDKNATSQQALTEIQRRYAGAAANYGRTAAGAQDRFKVALDELEEQIGGALLPTVTKYLNQGSRWLEKEENKKRVADDLNTSLQILAGTIQAGARGATLWDQAWRGFGGTIQHVVDTINGGDFKRALQTLEAMQRIQGRIKVASPDFSGVTGALTAVTNRQNAGNASVAKAVADAFKTGKLAEPKGATVEQRNTWFDNMIARLLGRAGDPASLRAQIGRLRTIAGLVQQRLQATKDITRRLRLEDELADITVQIRDRQQQAADTATAQRQQAAQQAAADRAAGWDRRLGWLQFGVEKAEATKAIADDRRAYKALEKALVDKIRSEGRTLELVRRLWDTRQRIRDLNKQQSDKDPLAGLMQVSSKRMANLLGAGLGLSPAGMGRLQANIAGQEIHNYVYMDGRQVAHSVNRANAQTGHRTSRQTSGFRG